jgi:phospholipid/cholesterol/gamma-HCH transport system substrate-binding protein
MVREGSVGLLVLAGLGIFGLSVAWLKGFNPANRSYQVTISFPTIAGIQSGSNVRYRGVTVGRITDVQATSSGVDVKISIAPADLVIPANTTASIDQSGLLGESVINLTPNIATVPTVTAKALDAKCDPIIVLCNGSSLKGGMGVSTDTLVASSIRFADTYGKPEFFNNINALTTNSGKAAAEIALLAKEFGILSKSVRQEVPQLSNTANSFSNTATIVGAAVAQAGGTADRASYTLDQVNALLANNRGTLVATLENLNATSGTLRTTVNQLTPTVNRIQQSRVLSDLETLSANAAIASKNLKDTSQSLSNPANLATLQQTLDAARATFQNVQKITADLDELTGDPNTRKQLKNMIKGLGGLLSSAQQIQQQAQYAQVLEPIQQQAVQQKATQLPPESVIMPPLTNPITNPIARPIEVTVSQPMIRPMTILPPQLSSRPVPIAPDRQ